MSNLTVFDFDGQAVRPTGDGRFSVLDVLVAFVEPTERKGKKAEAINPRQILKSITGRNPEVVQFLDNFKFPGKGQRQTPVANVEGICQILMLTPGNRAAEFRAWAAQVLRERIEEEKDGELAYQRGRDRAVRVWLKQGKTDREITQRIKSIETRNHFTDTLKNHGVAGKGYADCTNAIYMELFDADSKTIKAERNLPARIPAKDSFSLVESAANSLAEALADQDIEQASIYGNAQCKDASRRAARRVRKALN